MKKNDAQLSLFDINIETNFTKQLKNNQNEIQNEPELYSSKSSDNRGQDENGTGNSGREESVSRYENELSSTISTINPIEPINTIDKQGVGSLYENDESTPSKRLDGNRSTRSGMVELDSSIGNEYEPLQGSTRISSEKLNNFYRVDSEKQVSSFNKKNSLTDNINALTLIEKLETESRQPTKEEQTILSDFIGFGGIKEIILNPSIDQEWATKADIELKPLIQKTYDIFNQLDPDQSKGLLASAKRSINNAHFTPYNVINGIWKAIELTGFQKGKIIEPSSGIGNFLSTMPVNIANNSTVTAIEMDRVTGKILEYLYPSYETIITGFEKIKLPENHYDLVISNVPFGDVQLYDPQIHNNPDKSYKTASDNIHNFFFAKSILLAKPNAVIALITSRYTLDSTQNSELKNLIADKTEFLGAIRLPDTAFQNNANTKVVADIIFLRKFEDEETKIQKHNFIDVKTIPFQDKDKNGFISFNQYFHDNPTHMIGELEFGGLYDNDSFNLKGDKNVSIQSKIESIAIELFPKPFFKNEEEETLENINGFKTKLNQFDTVGNIIQIDDNKFGIISNDVFIDFDLDNKVKSIGLNPSKIRRNQFIKEDEKALLNTVGLTLDDFQLNQVEEIKVNRLDAIKIPYLIPVRSFTKELIFKESNNYNALSIEKTREQLNTAYNIFVSKFGNLINKNNQKLLSLDIDCFIIESLEIFDKETKKINKSDILNKRTINPPLEIINTDNLSDAITLSLQKFGKINTDYISGLMDTPFVEIMDTQKGENTFIFKDENDNYLYKDEYLSGDVLNKLNIAKNKLESEDNLDKKNLWANNVFHLEQVQPVPIHAQGIYCPIHTRWIPFDTIKDFVYETFETDKLSINYSSLDDLYNVSKNNFTIPTLDYFATKRKSGAWVLNHALNGIAPVVKYVSETVDGKEIILTDYEDTLLAKENYRKICTAWDDWKFNNFDRKNKLETLYNSIHNTTVLRKYDGSFLEFPNLVNYILKPHQKDAVFRNVQDGGGINDHIVGSGKTLIQIVTAMELKRLSISSKVMIIGLKSQVPQLYRTFKNAYPLAKILFPTEKDFEKNNRKRLLTKIATNDWDCVILSHDQFNRIKQPINIQIDLIEEIKSEISKAIINTDDKKEKKYLENRLYKEENKILNLLDSKKDKDVLDFSELGIDFLIVDESHEYKNLEYVTRKNNIRGLGNPKGSKKAFNLLVACRYLQDKYNADKGVLFSSGTTLSNSIAELYLLFKYLKPKTLENRNLNSFDKWSGVFANDYSELEYSLGRFKEVHRFREFVNLPELITMYREMADVRNDLNLKLDKPKIEYKLINLEPTDFQLEKIELLKEFVDTKGKINAEELGLTNGFDPVSGINTAASILAMNYARKLSIDPRLINPSYEDGCKLKVVAENLFSKYQSSSHFKGTQMMFCDLGTPKSSNTVDNLHSYFEGINTYSDSEIAGVFGENYYDLKTKPYLEIVKTKLIQTFNLEPEELESIIIEANQLTKFNVYDEVKSLLVKLGVPSNEIAFIHDYNTTIQKEQLYENVNNGNIRFLFASTKKGGTGINIQERMVAVHHVDVSYRPSDIIQQDGRAGRVGNIGAKEYNNNIVESIFYAVSRTFDATMYNINAQKNLFIQQIKVVADPLVRSAKDLQEDIDLGAMYAELSGNPITKELNTVRNKINELTLLKSSFESKKYSIQNDLENAKKLKNFYLNKISNLEKSIPLYNNIKRDDKGEPVFIGYVNNIQFDKLVDFSTAIINETVNLKNKGDKLIGQTFTIAKLWDFKVNVTLHINNLSKEKYVVKNVLNNLNNIIDSETVIDTLKPMQVGLQIKNTICNIQSDLETQKFKLKTTENNIETYQIQLESKFIYNKELEDNKRRLDEINVIIAKENAKEAAIKFEKNKIEEIDNKLQQFLAR